MRGLPRRGDYDGQIVTTEHHHCTGEKSGRTNLVEVSYTWVEAIRSWEPMLKTQRDSYPVADGTDFHFGRGYHG
jgi:hypothetical protein